MGKYLPKKKTGIVIGSIVGLFILAGIAGSHPQQPTSNLNTTPASNAQASDDSSLNTSSQSTDSTSTTATPSSTNSTSDSSTSTTPAPAPSPTPAPKPVTAPAPTPSPSQSCNPLTNGGNCYEPGEYCRDSDHGATGVAGDGKSIVCTDNDGWRWEPN